MHPLSLCVKTLATPDRVVLTCVACHLRHRVVGRAVAASEDQGGGERKEGWDDLAHCATGHATELRVSLVDVMVDAVILRCGACGRTYAIEVAAFEAYQKET